MIWHWVLFLSLLFTRCVFSSFLRDHEGMSAVTREIFGMNSRLRRIPKNHTLMIRFPPEIMFPFKQLANVWRLTLLDCSFTLEIRRSLLLFAHNWLFERETALKAISHPCLRPRRRRRLTFNTIVVVTNESAMETRTELLNLFWLNGRLSLSVGNDASKRT